ncbi:MAG: hypothetical protein PSV36_10980 [Algoriphagus sp.]|nr:hypothetical protein [Algoriphagus sp.]
MYTVKRLPFYALALATFAFASCESEDPVMENEEEVITDVTLSFTELNATGDPIGTKISFKASDPQGIELGTAPTIEPVNLIKGKTYRMEITVANAIANEDITSEILAEGDAHQFYFLGTAFVGSPPLTIAYDDASGQLIGLRTKVTVAASPGFNNATMRVILRHDLNKSYPGANNPNFQNYEQAGGESDLDINFPLVIN